MENKQKLASSICEFLSDCLVDKTIKAEDCDSIQVALQCIGEAFGVTPGVTSGVTGTKLSAIFDVYLATQSKLSSEPNKVKDGDKIDKNRAEELKSAGNKAMAAKDFSESISCYTQAIAMDATNPVYFSNRAAAYSQQGNHAEAIADAKAALALDVNYSKGYSRLGHALFCSGRFSDAVDAYEKGLEIEPNNATFKQSLAAARQKAGMDVAPTTASNGSNPLAGLAGMAGMGGMPGMGGMDFGAMMNNPEFMKMATSMMSNPNFADMMAKPEIAEMAQSLMKDPDALGNLMKNPALSNLLNKN